MLCDYLNANVTKEKAKRQTLCHSLAGNKVEYLFITNKVKKPEDIPAENQPEDNYSINLKKKQEKEGATNKAINSVISPTKLVSPLKK